MKTLSTSLSPVFDRAHQAASRHRDMRFEFWRGGHHAIDLVRVIRFDFFPVPVVPPIVHPVPWPMLNVKNIIAEHGHAVVKASRNSVDRGAHQRDGDDADDDAERGQDRSASCSLRICAAAIFQLSVSS